MKNIRDYDLKTAIDLMELWRHYKWFSLNLTINELLLKLKVEKHRRDSRANEETIRVLEKEIADNKNEIAKIKNEK